MAQESSDRRFSLSDRVTESVMLELNTVKTIFQIGPASRSAFLNCFTFTFRVDKPASQTDEIAGCRLILTKPGPEIS